MTTTKQKLRGRWIDLPYSNLIKDFCGAYFDNGTYWNDHITRFFVGDERICPPLKYVNVIEMENRDEFKDLIKIIFEISLSSSYRYQLTWFLVWNSTYQLPYRLANICLVQ